jgi:hypothetical protein
LLQITDRPYGQRVTIDELMEWFGLTENLTTTEQLDVKKERALLIEGELYIERLKQTGQLDGLS